MTSSDNPLPGHGSNSVSRRFAMIRDDVLAEWKARVLRRIARAAIVEETVLFDALPMMYDGLVEALAPGTPRKLATSGTNLAQAHGIERARRSPFRARDVVEEMLIFRDAIFSVASAVQLTFDRHQVETIVRSIDAAMLESLSNFSTVREGNLDIISTTLRHDLRGSLHMANASAQLIGLQSTTPVIVRLAQQITARLADANGMIDRLVEAAALHRHTQLPLQVSEFDLEAMVLDVASDMALAENIVLFSDHQFRGFWCMRSLKRAVRSLLSNAQKYGPENRPITITLTRFHHRVLLSIHNDGPPILPAIRDCMFRPPQRAGGVDLSRRDVGLPLVQSVAESHGGSIIVDSEAGRGTTFSLNLPIDCRPFVAGD
jgi:signal transduction histidine kinase